MLTTRKVPKADFTSGSVLRCGVRVKRNKMEMITTVKAVTAFSEVSQHCWKHLATPRPNQPVNNS
jgi:hypothetical protein